MPDQSLPKLEEKILQFWKKNKIFEKSLALRKKAKPFRFFEGPPTANAIPGIHHALARAFKDIICRYKAMRGFYVERKAGWDTHGLPVELRIEKELEFQTKADIEKYGIAKFNKKAKASVWSNIQDWDRFTERLAFWIDLAHPYVTYDVRYMESLWWIIKRIWQKKLLEEDYKVVPYCPRCETALSSHEVAQGYEDVTEGSVYIKFKVRDAKLKNHFLLAWTTTPWTLPGNVALAVHPKIDYSWVRLENRDVLILASARLSTLGRPYEVLQITKGAKLVGMRYEPLFDSLAKLKIPNIKNAFRVLSAEFASAEEGTGIVHTAVMYGEEDFELGRKHKLPMHHTVDEHGKFTRDVPEWQGKFVKDVDKDIELNLEKRGLLLKREIIAHTYPFCWRCTSPLLYYAHKSWFVRMRKLKKQLISNNEKINWVPGHIKEGRFGEWLREIKDWAFSRERYWGTPLPIWKCKECGNVHAVGSLEELSKMAYGRNDYFRMRHGGADHIVKDYIAGWPEKKSMVAHLTEEGKRQVERSALQLKKRRIDLIVSSDLTRMKETVAILKKHLRGAKVIYDPRLREYNTGIFNYGPTKAFHRFFKNSLQKFDKKPPRGETLQHALDRYAAVLKDLESKYRDKRILILGHGDPMWALEGTLKSMSREEITASPYPKLGRWEHLQVPRLPENDAGDVDLHRPYVDAFLLACPLCNKGKMKRIEHVADAWFDSGAMPFAQWHYPFENKNCVDTGKSFPADYITEGVDQTRGWFYTLLAVSTLLGKGAPYLNVISLGHILDAKGEKMSKSKGNIVDPWEMFRKYGADSLRWYFFTINPPGEPKRFSERDLAISSQDLVMLLNVLNFWKTYAPETLSESISAGNFTPLDSWILARLDETSRAAARSLDHYDIREASLSIKAFLDDLSRWYVRRSRPRLQRPKSKYELAQAARVLGEVLVRLAKTMAPFTPFVAEVLWKDVTSRIGASGFWEESVHLARYPAAQSFTPKTKALLSDMGTIRKLASLVLRLRAQAGLKVRQPLGTLYVMQSKETAELNTLLPILADEVNVKKINLVKALPEVPNVKTVQQGTLGVSLDITLTKGLQEEGMIREVLRSIQEARQDMGLHPADLVRITVSAKGEVAKLIRAHVSFLKKESRAVAFGFGKSGKAGLKKEIELGEEKLVIGMAKVKQVR